MQDESLVEGGLQDRERLLVQLAAALAIAFLGWLLILRPLGAAKIRLTASVAQLQGQIGLAQTQTQANTCCPQCRSGRCRAACGPLIDGAHRRLRA